MKRLVHILVLAMVLTSCTPSVETRHGASLQTDDMHQRLAAIDSLMWQQPDSALAVLVDFAASLQADSLDAFDGHYCQMLVSELLYKNDCEQANRTELLRVVDYFDSVCGMQTAGRDASWHVSTHNELIHFCSSSGGLSSLRFHFGRFSSPTSQKLCTFARWLNVPFFL